MTARVACGEMALLQTLAAFNALMRLFWDRLCAEDRKHQCARIFADKDCGRAGTVRGLERRGRCSACAVDVEARYDRGLQTRSTRVRHHTRLLWETAPMSKPTMVKQPCPN